MRVSVVIPAFNEEKNIKKCLEAILNQEEKADEIIVVDNNSTDKTIDIVKKYKNIKIIKEKKQGITQSRNTGFNKATGDILIKCDADTLLKGDFIKKVKITFSKKKNIAALSFPLAAHDLFLKEKTIFVFYLYMLIPRLILGYFPTITCYAIKKTSWEKIKNSLCKNDKEAHEDIDLSLHLKEKGEKIYHDKKNVVLTSIRRIRYKPWSFFVDYTLLFFKMLKTHRIKFV